jgi:glycosyltransferase involved in cell wall biosynthesis
MALAVISLRNLVLFICIPVYNEAPTVGLLLWRLRKVFQEYSREYEVLVFDDGSTDATPETLRPYAKVLPLTTLGGRERVGYARALDALLRTAAKRTRYPRRDAAVTLQGDFTDRPEHLPELIKRFEGGADLVVSERASDDVMPAPVRRLRRVAPWVLRPFASSVPGVTDPFGSFRLYRVSVIRDLIKERGDAPLADGTGWGANVDLLIGAARHARRVETVEVAPRYDLRPRESRVRPWADAVSLFRLGRTARGRWTINGTLRAPAEAAG